MRFPEGSGDIVIRIQRCVLEGMMLESQPGSVEKWRVVVFAAPDERHDLSRVLERVLGLHPTDASQQSRTAPGVLAGEFTRDVALQLAAEIQETGLNAQALLAAQVPRLDGIPPVHHVRCLDAGLEVIELHGQTESLVAWPDVCLISLGQVPQENTRHFLQGEMMALSTARRTGDAPVDSHLSPGPETWIICRNPERILCIDHKRMNYEYLGDRKTDSATANFRLFLADVAARATEAYKTPAVHAFLEHGSVTDYSFDSAKDLRRATVLHLLIATAH